MVSIVLEVVCQTYVASYDSVLRFTISPNPNRCGTEPTQPGTDHSQVAFR